MDIECICFLFQSERVIGVTQKSATINSPMNDESLFYETYLGKIHKYFY